MEKQVRIEIVEDRLEEYVTLGEFLKVQKGDLEATTSMMSKFVLDENGNYLSFKEGREVLEGLTFKELRESAQNFEKKIKDAVVPPQNASD